MNVEETPAAETAAPYQYDTIPFRSYRFQHVPVGELWGFITMRGGIFRPASCPATFCILSVCLNRARDNTSRFLVLGLLKHTEHELFLIANY